MQLLSTRAREAIKTGLAMTLAYGVALSMDWDRAYWAAYAVAVISLSTQGQSLNKGAMRLVGTGAAATVALLLLAAFPQDRWWMLGGLSLWVGFCSYQMTGPKRQYLWYVAGFVSLIIVVDAQADPATAFNVTVTRTLETGLGILCYTLVSVFLWPQNSVRALDDSVGSLFRTQAAILRQTASQTLLDPPNGDAQSEQLRQAQLLAQAAQALEAAESDTYEVWEARRAWRRHVALSNSLATALESWRASLPEIGRVDVGALFPNLREVLRDLERQLDAIASSLAGETSRPVDPPRVELRVDRERLTALSHFERAAAAVTRTQIDRVTSLLAELKDVVRGIRGRESLADFDAAPRPPWSLDPARLEGALRVVTNLCLAYLVWIYVDPPGHSGFVTFAPVLAMLAAQAPTLSTLSLFGPFALGCALGGIVYVFVMPQLVGFAELGLVIFAMTAGIYYVFAAPSQGIAKMGAIIPFVTLISVTNSQTYSFASYASSVAMIGLALGLTVFTSYLPPSPRPEKRFLRGLARFFGAAERLVSELAFDVAKSPPKAAARDRALLAIPSELQTWGDRIDHASFPEPTPERIHGIVASLHLLAHRLVDLREARSQPQATLLVDHMLGDLRAWRQVLEEGLGEWSREPGRDLGKDLEQRLAARLATLELRTAETFALAEAGKITPREYQNFYSVLGSYRGLAEAMIHLAGTTRGARLGDLAEARF